MTNFYTAPIGADQLEGRFTIPGGQVTPEDLERLAGVINDAVETDKTAVWMNPETDGRAVRVHGDPVKIGGEVLKYTHSSDLAVFPKPHNNPER
jgi:hypothetical protein